MAGIFPEDLPSDPETLNGKLHGIGAGLGSLALIGCVALAPRLTGHRALWLAFGAAVVGFVLFLGAKEPNNFAGVWQKLYFGSAYLALIAVAVAVRQTARHA